MKKAFLVVGLLFLLCLLSEHVLAQDSTRVIKIDRFGWMISIPTKYKDFTAERQAASKQRGLDKIEEVEGIKVEDHAVTMLMVQSNQLNYLDAVYQPYNNTEWVDYDTYCKAVDEVVYRTFSNILGGSALDTSTGKIMVSGLEFRRFSLEGKLPDGRPMKLFMFSRPFGKEEFALNILAVDAEDEKALLNAWLNSRFEK